jgi:Holliday junction resolvasome RuvABC endonuclease subunit
MQFPRYRPIMGIDPGLNACGIARWDPQAQTMTAQTVYPKTKDMLGRIETICSALPRLLPSIHTLVIEMPQVYQYAKADPNDLVLLSIAVGAIARDVRPRVLLLPTPAQWKGQVPKAIHHRRIRKLVPNIHGSTSKDALDAVGLCLYGINHALAHP